jgi:hypothetical protein
VALIVIGSLLVLTVVALVVSNHNDWTQHDALFLAQCREAGYDAAKCRFFLTATGRMGSDAVMQMIEATP